MGDNGRMWPGTRPFVWRWIRRVALIRESRLSNSLYSSRNGNGEIKNSATTSSVSGQRFVRPIRRPSPRQVPETKKKNPPRLIGYGRFSQIKIKTMRCVGARANAALGGEIGLLTTRDLPLAVRGEEPHAANARARPIDKNAHDGSRPHKTPPAPALAAARGVFEGFKSNQIHFGDRTGGGAGRRFVAGLGRDRRRSRKKKKKKKRCLDN